MDSRVQQIGGVLESIVAWSLVLGQGRSLPFGDVRLTRSQIDTLFLIAHALEPVTPRSIATALALTPGAITQLVDGLRCEGLVTTQANPQDARSRVLTLTESAAARVASFEQEVAENMLAQFTSLTDTELARLAELLGRTRGTL
jgi:DNA-binding MarR family transcriptional regulator